MDERNSALEFRRKPRTSAQAEAALADVLRSAPASGCRFRRQHPVGPYVLEFYCPERRVAVELRAVGSGTRETRFHDEVRTRYLASFGVRVVIVDEADVLGDAAGVAAELSRALAEAAAPVVTAGRRAR